LKKGKEVQVGYERKMKMDQQFPDDLDRSDIRKYEYFDWADNMLILHGTKDKLAPIEDSREFAENNVITFLPVENANHTFSDPKTSDFAAHTIVEFFGPEQ
ncbi:alpha/beta hydrolase family protein, partial [Acidaminococcus fermentans]|uniref:alpha/beta hydrolase family protein n=1 Tax=Acidaminococcus fermentans TaxID=905 RepID=UPI003C6D0078